jgi:hypothetical protein
MAEANRLYTPTCNRIEDHRFALARELVPLARLLRDRAKTQADLFGPLDRRFGTDEIRHLARLIDDVWMTLDTLITDVEQEA